MNRWTKLVSYEPAPGDPHRPSSTPLYQTATFRQPDAVGSGAYDYSRSGNPTRHILEERLAELEEGKHGFAFSSGMAALSAVTRLAIAGDHIVACSDLYGGTYRLLTQVVAHHGIDITFVDTTNPQALEEAIQENTRLVLLETPSNPLLRITDIRHAAQVTKRAGALLVVDNTLLSPWLQQPLTLGADIVVHSATKHLGGHGDVTAGAIITNDEEAARRIGFVQNAEGTGLAPFDAWLLLRGIKTLGLRIERQQQTAQSVASFLQSHPAIQAVHYPGLDDHPGRAVHEGQAQGAGLLLSFETGNVSFSKALVEACRRFDIAVSFGNLHSTIGMPCALSHSSIPEEERTLPHDLVRVSVGIEHGDDLIEDLKQALQRAESAQLQAA